MLERGVILYVLLGFCFLVYHLQRAENPLEFGLREYILASLTLWLGWIFFAGVLLFTRKRSA